MTLAGLDPATYEVELGGVADNCSVESVSVPVVPEETAAVSVCAAIAPSIASTNALQGRISPASRNHLRAIGIVEAQNRSLRHDVGCAQTRPDARGCPRSWSGGRGETRPKIPVATPLSAKAVAKYIGLPGTISSGWRT